MRRAISWGRYHWLGGYKSFDPHIAIDFTGAPDESVVAWPCCALKKSNKEAKTVHLTGVNVISIVNLDSCNNYLMRIAHSGKAASENTPEQLLRVSCRTSCIRRVN